MTAHSYLFFSFILTAITHVHRGLEIRTGCPNSFCTSASQIQPQREQAPSWGIFFYFSKATTVLPTWRGRVLLLNDSMHNNPIGKMFTNQTFLRRSQTNLGFPLCNYKHSIHLTSKLSIHHHPSHVSFLVFIMRFDASWPHRLWSS